MFKKTIVLSFALIFLVVAAFTMINKAEANKIDGLVVGAEFGSNAQNQQTQTHRCFYNRQFPVQAALARAAPNLWQSLSPNSIALPGCNNNVVLNNVPTIDILGNGMAQFAYINYLSKHVAVPNSTALAPTVHRPQAKIASYVVGQTIILGKSAETCGIAADMVIQMRLPMAGKYNLFGHATIAGANSISSA